MMKYSLFVHSLEFILGWKTALKNQARKTCWLHLDAGIAVLLDINNKKKNKTIYRNSLGIFFGLQPNGQKIMPIIL